MRTALEATRRQVRELVDGTLEVKLHVEPRLKADFHRLFPSIDSPVAIAPLRLGPAAETDEAVVAAANDAVKGGELCKLAAILCGDEAFQAWIAGQPDVDEDVTVNEELGVDAEERAAMMIRRMCGIESRRELDHNANAAHLFHERIRKPWMAHCARGR